MLYLGTKNNISGLLMKPISVFAVVSLVGGCIWFLTGFFNFNASPIATIIVGGFGGLIVSTIIFLAVVKTALGETK